MANTPITGIAHWWRYHKHNLWRCDYCDGKTGNPTLGAARLETCPGKPKGKGKGR